MSNGTSKKTSDDSDHMGKISRNDIETKLRQIKDEVDITATAAKPALLSTAAGGVALIVGAAFAIGQRKARRRTTVVEIRRV